MKKSIVLIVVLLLQLVLITSFACEINVTVNSVNSSSHSQISKIEKGDSFLYLTSSNEASDHSSEDFFHCNHCEGCTHFLLTKDDSVSLKGFNSFYSLNFFYILIYTQPNLSFLSKPPIQS